MSPETTLALPQELSVPTLPRIVLEIDRLIADEDSGTREIGQLVAKDVGLSGRVLRIANSSFYGLPSRCVSTEQACTFLGARVLRTIVTQVAAIEAFGSAAGPLGRLMDDVWKHSVLTAQAAALIARRAAVDSQLAPDEHYVCGLLHDAGRLVLLNGLGTAYAEVADEAESSGTPLHVCEAARLGYDHAMIGAIVAGRWGLPLAAVDAIRHHHAPTVDPVRSVLVLANELVDLVPAWDGARAWSLFGDDTREALGLTPADVEEILEAVRTHPEVEL